MSAGMCLLSNRLIPLPLNDDTSVSGGNGVSVSDLEVSTVLGVFDVAFKERGGLVANVSQKASRIPFF